MQPLPQIDELFRRERRAAIAAHPTQIGLDYIVAERRDDNASSSWRLWLHFIPPGGGKVKEATLTAGNIRILTAAGAPAPHVRVDALQEEREGYRLDLKIDTQGGKAVQGAALLLELVGVPGLDPFFTRAPFSLLPDGTADLDPRPAPLPPAEPPPDLAIDYLARDYASFRRLLLDRLALLMPGWAERRAADLGVALVELMAGAADQLSYYQDAVATEAYLDTARLRTSVRRHARLIDYPMHEGCNARAWVQIQVSGELVLPRGARLLTRAGTGPLLAEADLPRALSAGGQLFETMHPARLHPAHNELHFYTWGARQWTIPQGATRATLRRPGAGDGAQEMIGLQPGDVLVFVQRLDPATGRGGDPAVRQAVRLTAVDATALDPLTGERIVEVEWAAADALRFPLPVAGLRGAGMVEHISVALGNIVLADHGHTVTEDLPAVPQGRRYAPRLQRRGLTFAAPLERQTSSGLAAQVVGAPRAATPAITIRELGAGGASPLWTPRRDLLNSDRFAREFVVEMESDGRAALRFGDGVRGRRPTAGVPLTATYRVGGGTAGSVGRDTIVHLVGDWPGVLRVHNPLPAEGGVAPEPVEQVRLAAPAAFHSQERCVTADDYAAAARRHPAVQQAAALLRWTGSWYTAFVAVARRDGQPVDDHFRAELRAFLERFRPAGYDIAVRPPRYVALAIVLPVAAAPDAFASTVRQTLRETFSAADMPGGRRGFFHPDNFAFGQPVYLSQLIAAAMAAPGVAQIDARPRAGAAFQRWGRPPRAELDDGLIPIGSLEIARLDNDSAVPQNGTISFIVTGGR